MVAGTNPVSALLIAGPTASGKSAIALSLARRLRGTLINADSMQVYRDLRVLTARPPLQETETWPHLLFGHVDGAFNYSVGRWLAEVKDLLEHVRKNGRLPIFVGGSGLYFKALTQGLSNIPPVPPKVRMAMRERAQTIPVQVLHAELAACDPIMAARLRPSDPQRILRALEVFHATGRSLASFQSARSKPIIDVEKSVAIFLEPDRETLRRQIDWRFDRMLETGGLSEVERLMKRKLDPTLPVMRAHGVPHLISHLQGQIAIKDAADRAKLDTRHYAKRQFTFARHQLPPFRWIEPNRAEAEVLSAFGKSGR
jgi:tRNA dimethylallyltransferase